ncbi:MAG TPA: ferric reductase-like transmembrane domain-containing protein [Bryobacteraceae bacterium]|jgi:predicted ferric reductase
MFDDVSAIDISSTVGLVAMVLFTLNILMGLLVSVNYNTVKQWPHRKLPVPLYKLHNWNAYLAISVAVLHPVILLCSSTARFKVLDVLWPLDSPGQRLYNVLGALTFYLFTLVVVTSYLRRRLGHVAWKRIHYFAYGAAAAMFIHGTLIDQNLKGQTPDFLDGEKVLIEGCFLLVVGASIWRWRYGSEKKRYLARKAAGSYASAG